ncbi:CHAT domain-containing protein [Streptomyces sp. NPDC044780]|uniref:CHAT domain-containing protein n=1 Tax=unclassified Streptomyces TaxID=2593676 RepID=UPI0033C3973A
MPWHAACIGERKACCYACQEAQLSYLPSARLLYEVAARPASAVRQALIVGNPTGDMQYAEEEAAAIHYAFYPDGVTCSASVMPPLLR